MKDNWRKVKISDIGEVISGGTPSTDVNEFWDGEIVWITPADLSKIRFAEINTSKRKISDLGLNSSSATLIPKNSIVLSSRAPIGYFAVPSVDFSTNQGCKSIRLFPEQDTYFHYYNFLFNVEKFKSKGEGTTFAEISKKEIEKIELEIPPYAQQKKIAKILSTCDEVIEKTEAAIAKYKAIKQGMMHDLFTRGIDTATGKLRPSYQEAPELYKESALGMIPKEWEEGRFIDFADGKINYSFTGGPFGSDLQSKDYTKSGIQIIQLQNIGDGIFKDDYQIFTSIEKANELISCNIYPGEIIISKMAEPIARACIIPNTSNRFVMASDGIRLSINKSKFNSTFVLETINYKRFRNIAELKASGTTRSRIGLTELKNIIVLLPNFIEQNLIGSRLESLSNQIKAEEFSLSKYKKIKEGLMQDLLTGRVEVSV